MNLWEKDLRAFQSSGRFSLGIDLLLVFPVILSVKDVEKDLLPRVEMRSVRVLIVDFSSNRLEYRSY